SEEHTSELQSRGHLVCRLLLEKKKNPPRRQRPDDPAPRLRDERLLLPASTSDPAIPRGVQHPALLCLGRRPGGAVAAVATRNPRGAVPRPDAGRAGPPSRDPRLPYGRLIVTRFARAC